MLQHDGQPVCFGFCQLIFSNQLMGSADLCTAPCLSLLPYLLSSLYRAALELAGP